MRTYTDYPVSSYGGMLTDVERMTAYTGALRQAVTEDSVVLDIGCGTGFFSIYAAKLGARRVVAVEDNESIEVAQVLAEKNGVADRIEFVNGLSTQLDFGERFDVIVSDLRGVLPLFGHHIDSLADARARLLTPNGTLLPQGDKIHVALAESKKIAMDRTGPDLVELYGVDMRAADGPQVPLVWLDGVLTANDLRSESVVWADVNYGIRTEADVTGVVELIATSDCHLDGLALWFDATIADGFGYSNRPRRKGSTYGHSSVVLQEPIDLEKGSRVDVELEARLVGDDYTWRWSIEATTPCGVIIGGETGSSALAEFTSVAQLRRRSEHYVPELSVDGRVSRDVLTGIDGEADLGTIARQLVDQFPGRWSSWESALGLVADIAEVHAD